MMMRETRIDAEKKLPASIVRMLRSRSGDTLIEVMASIFLFLIMMGILQGAVAYSGRALLKNQEIRKENSKILEAVSKATPTKAAGIGTAIQTFRATDSSLTAVGNDVFRVTTGLYQIQAEGVNFAIYGIDESKDTEDAESEAQSGEAGTDTGGEGS